MKPAISVMAVSTTHFLGPLFCLLSLAAVPARGQELSLDFLRAQIQQRVARFATVDYSWTATSHFTPEHARMLSAIPFNESTGDISNEFPATLEWRGRLLFDGLKLRLEHNRPDWNFRLRQFHQGERIETFDGLTGMTLISNPADPFPLRGGVAEELPADRLFGATDFGPLVNHFRSLAYPGIIFDDKLVDGAELSWQDLAGNRYAVVRDRMRTPDGVLEHTLWLDPNARYAVRRRTSRVDERVSCDLRMTWANVDGMVVPKTITREDINSRSGKLRRITTYTMTEVVLNKPIPAGLFTIEFPPGAVLADARRAMPPPKSSASGEQQAAPPASQPQPPASRIVVVREDGTKHAFDMQQIQHVKSAPELLALTHNDRTSAMWWITLAALGAVAILALARAFYRHSRRT